MGLGESHSQQLQTMLEMTGRAASITRDRNVLQAAIEAVENLLRFEEQEIKNKTEEYFRIQEKEGLRNSTLNVDSLKLIQKEIEVFTNPAKIHELEGIKSTFVQIETKLDELEMELYNITMEISGGRSFSEILEPMKNRTEELIPAVSSASSNNTEILLQSRPRLPPIKRQCPSEALKNSLRRMRLNC